MALGTFDDMWFQWIIDFGMPGPDRGAGGRFLLVPPGYDGPLPEGGFYVAHSRTNRALMLGRSFLEDDDPAPTVATIKSTLKIYPYTVGWAGHQRRHPPPRARCRSRRPPPTCRRRRSSRAPARRSTRSRRPTPGSSRPCTPCCRTSPPTPATRRSSATSPSSASSRASRSPPTSGCAASSTRPPPSATPRRGR